MRILKVLYTSDPSSVILAWMGDELSLVIDVPTDKC